jgi:hypothetical protein
MRLIERDANLVTKDYTLSAPVFAAKGGRSTLARRAERFAANAAEAETWKRDPDVTIER